MGRKIWRGKKSVWRATYEIDFWHDFVAGYEVEAYAWDKAENVGATTTAGGLEYVVEGLVASFLSLFMFPEQAGGILGFFVGFGKGLYEDLTIFLHLAEIWEGIKAMPSLIAELVGNTTLLLAMVQDMVNGLLAKANLINPYGPSAMNATTFGEWLVDVFWWYVDPINNPFPSLPDKADRFNLAFAVNHLTGFLIQQFIVGTGLVKVLGKLSDAAAFTRIVNRLQDAASAVRKVVEATKGLAVAAKNRLITVIYRNAARYLDDLGLAKRGDLIPGAQRLLAKFGDDPAVINQMVDNLNLKRGVRVTPEDFVRIAKENPKGWENWFDNILTNPRTGTRSR